MIRLENIEKTIGKKEILKQISLTLEDGKMYLLNGHNGCGKSMLLRMMCGLIKPTGGIINCDRNYSYGVIIENSTFIENETALYNMKYLAAINQKIGVDEINEMLKQLNLYNKRNEKVKTYSLGMRQRLGICQALMEDPDVMLLDEPFNALDEENYQIVFELLKERREKNKLVVVAAHSVEEAYKKEFDAIISMKNGEIVFVQDNV